jgi:ABC-type nitrate/sulfonate/bicarbonate transport system permease component
MAILLLMFGLFFKGGLRVIELLASSSQTIPFLVIVAIFLLIEKPLFRALSFTPRADVYCLLPVTLALVFPPLANGAEAIAQMPIQLKALSRRWNAPSSWRIRRIYLPCAINDILTGVRASATWAVGATLITEGLLNGVEGDSDTLGHALLRPFSSSAHPGKTPAVILIATILGFAVYYLFVVLQRRVDRRLRGITAGKERDFPL